MGISQDELKKIAKKLSKLPGCDEALIWNINDTLKYVELLSEVDTEGVIPTVSVISENSLLREDNEVRNIKGNKLLECSKQNIVSDYITLPNIMK